MTNHIDRIPAPPKCEMCGQSLEHDEKEYPAQELIIRLAFIAEKSPSIALLLVHHLAGRSYAELARKHKVSRQAVQQKVKGALKRLTKASF